MKKLFLAVIMSLVSSAALAQNFSVSFTWDGLELCDTGRPNTVGNPVFTLSNIPAGTTWLHFKLTDLDVPGYPHGGGWIEYTGETTLPDVFEYQSPCPPRGSHKYEWKVTATGAKDSNDVLGTATMVQDYPD